MKSTKILGVDAKWYPPLGLWVLLAVFVCFGVTHCDVSVAVTPLDANIPPDVKVKVERLMDSRNFVEAEKFAREQNLDQRIIAMIMAHAGKKNEAFSMWFEYIHSVPANDREAVVRQAAHLLSSVSHSWEKEFFCEVVRQNVVVFDKNETLCRETDSLTRDDRIEEASKLFEQVLDSSYADEYLIRVAMLLISKMNQDVDKREKVKDYLDKLMKKFPDHLGVRLQRIVSLALLTPSQALVEIDELRDKHPEFYAARKSFIHVVRANAFENLGERDRAKSEYVALLGIDSDNAIAKGKIDYYDAQDRLEQDLQKKVAEVNPKYELTPRPRRWGVIIVMNTIFIALILYSIYGRKKQ